MRRRHAVLAVVVVLLVVVGLGVGAVAWITGRALPETSGTLRIPGLGATAAVRRDVNGIAQIEATDPHDLFMAQGYVHAQERMWQMEVWRHISSGRLAELFGPGSVDDDRFIRTLGWRQAAERDLALLAPNQRPVQITDDLASFWRTTYAQVRAELRGRYPRHAWPEDPSSATPTSRTKRRQ